MRRFITTVAISAIAMTVLVGCSSAGADSGTGPGAGGVWSPDQWTPSVTVTPVTYTDEEKIAIHEEWVRRTAGHWGIEVEDIEPVRWATTLRESGELLAECLREEGITQAQADVTGGIHYEPGIGPEQEDSWHQAYIRCIARYPVNPELSAQPTEEQWGLMWEYWDEYFVPCMEAEGFEVSREGQGTKESFVAAMTAGQGQPWYPTETFDVLPISEQERLVDVCPPMPPARALYGR